MIKAFMEHPIIFSILVITILMIISLTVDSVIRNILSYKSAKLLGFLEDEEHEN